MDDTLSSVGVFLPFALFLLAIVLSVLLQYKFLIPPLVSSNSSWICDFWLFRTWSICCKFILLKSTTVTPMTAWSMFCQILRTSLHSVGNAAVFWVTFCLDRMWTFLWHDKFLNIILRNICSKSIKTEVNLNSVTTYRYIKTSFYNFDIWF